VLDKRAFYINGQWQAPTTGNDFDVINPSNEEPCAIISLGGQADTDAAVAAANVAFDAWRETPKEERLALIEKLAEIYMARAEEMGEVISLEMGAPIAMSKAAQAGAGSGHIKSFIRDFKSFEFDRELGPHAPGDRILMEPVGFCGLITPWNWPMNQVTLKVIPALAAG